MIWRLRLPRLIALGGAVLAAVWTGLVTAPHLAGWRSPVDALEAPLADLRLLMAGPLPSPAEVVIVAIDDATLAEPGAGFPLPRARLADIIGKVAAAGPRALALDVLLLDAKDGAADAALADALQQVPTVIAAAGRFTGDHSSPGLPKTASELWPMPDFAAKAKVGLVNIVTDASGTPRHAPLLYLTSRGLQPSLVLEAAALFLGAQSRVEADGVRIGGRAWPTDYGFHLPLRALGPAGTVRTVSARAILAGESAQALAGRMVMLGFTATAVSDRFVTPFDPVTPGVEVLAGAVAQLVGPHRLIRTGAIRRWDALAAGALAIGGAVLAALLPVSLGVTIALAALGMWLGAVFLLFAEGYWLSAALPLVASLPPIAGAALARHLYEQRLARRSRQAATALSQFHAPALAERIARDPDFLSRPVTRPLAIFFVDLAGFTGMSEALGLAGTRDLLKRFHSCVAQEVAAHGGVVLNYMGDGAFGAFGLPEPGAGDADNALAAAFALAAAIGRISAPVEAGKAPALRIGLHHGPAVLSRLGHDTHQQVTISGDSVNLASRLMEVAKAEGAVIAASADLLVAMAAPPARPPDVRRSVPIRGRVAGVEVALWRVIPPSSEQTGAPSR